jgi:hypothetical protein
VFKRINVIYSKQSSIVSHRGAISVCDGLTKLLNIDAKLFSEPGPSL